MCAFSGSRGEPADGSIPTLEFSSGGERVDRGRGNVWETVCRRLNGVVIVRAPGTLAWSTAKMTGHF